MYFYKKQKIDLIKISILLKKKFEQILPNLLINFKIKYNFSKLYFLLFSMLSQVIKPIFKKWKWKFLINRYIFAFIIFFCFYEINLLVELLSFHFLQLKQKTKQRSMFSNLEFIFKRLPWSLFNIKGILWQLKGKINARPRKKKATYFVGNISSQSLLVKQVKINKTVLTRWGSYGLLLHFWLAK